LENRTRDTPLQGVYIPRFDQISVLGSYTLIFASMGVKFGVGEGTLGLVLRAKFHPPSISATCHPCVVKIAHSHVGL